VNGWEETFGREFFPHENNLAKFISESEGPVDEEVIWFEDFEPDFDEEEEIYQRTRPKEPVQEPPAEKDYITSCCICCGPLADQVSATKCGHVFCTRQIFRSTSTPNLLTLQITVVSNDHSSTVERVLCATAPVAHKTLGACIYFKEPTSTFVIYSICFHRGVIPQTFIHPAHK
jgi:hypothetical protein